MICGCANGSANNVAGENTNTSRTRGESRPLVLVVWRDAATQSDLTLDEAKRLEPPEVCSVGYLVTYNTIKIVLAPSVLEEQFAMDVLAIPTDWVTSVLRLDLTTDLLVPKETD